MYFASSGPSRTPPLVVFFVSNVTSRLRDFLLEALASFDPCFPARPIPFRMRFRFRFSRSSYPPTSPAHPLYSSAFVSEHRITQFSITLYLIVILMACAMYNTLFSNPHLLNMSTVIALGLHYSLTLSEWINKYCTHILYSVHSKIHQVNNNDLSEFSIGSGIRQSEYGLGHLSTNSTHPISRSIGASRRMKAKRWTWERLITKYSYLFLEQLLNYTQ